MPIGVGEKPGPYIRRDAVDELEGGIDLCGRIVIGVNTPEITFALVSLPNLGQCYVAMVPTVASNVH